MSDFDYPVYLGSAWMPFAVSALYLSTVIESRRAAPFGGLFLTFLLGIIAMHLAVAATEWWAQDDE